MGTETFSGSDDGGATLGENADFRPEFDKVLVGSPASSNLTVGSVVGTPLSRAIITVEHGLGIERGTAFQLNNMLFVCTTGDCPEPFVGMPCDFDTSGSCDQYDINFLADSVRNGITDPRLNLDGIGGDIPNDADFEYYITDEAYLGTGLGDHDLNRIVNFTDFVIISNNFGTSGLHDGSFMLNTGGRRAGWAEGNGNTDVATNFNDFVLLSNNFGMSFVSGESNVPEPTAVALMALGMLVAKGFRVRC